MFFKHLIPPFAKMCIFFNMRMEQLHFPLCQMLRKFEACSGKRRVFFFKYRTDVLDWLCKI